MTHPGIPASRIVPHVSTAFVSTALAAGLCIWWSLDLPLSERGVVAACLRSSTTEIGDLVASLVSGEQYGDTAHLAAPDTAEGLRLV
jgi:hypothetical protein